MFLNFFTFIVDTYVEFVDLTRSRKGTFVSDEKDQAEKIINDIVFMDAAYDLNQLPDLSTGKSSKRFEMLTLQKLKSLFNKELSVYSLQIQKIQ